MTALAMKQRGLKPAAKIVLYWLADHHNGETGQCNPSINRLAKCCEMSRRSVENHLQDLASMGLIQIHNQTRDVGGKTANFYVLCLKGSDAQNLRMGSAKSAHGDAQNLRMMNLVSINHVKEPTPLPPKGDDRFDEFWDCVPKKVGKGQARRAWKAAVKKEAPDAIISAMKRYAASRKGEDPQYTAHPSSWLNGERWADEGAKERGLTSEAIAAIKEGTKSPVPSVREHFERTLKRLTEEGKI